MCLCLGILYYNVCSIRTMNMCAVCGGGSSTITRPRAMAKYDTRIIIIIIMVHFITKIIYGFII